jgi:hypothetical protein
VPGLADELGAAARAWAEQTAQAQGLPRRVERMDVLRSVAVLFGARPSRGLGAPDRSEPGGIEAVEAAPSGTDNDVIEHRLDDLSLTG